MDCQQVDLGEGIVDAEDLNYVSKQIHIVDFRLICVSEVVDSRARTKEEKGYRRESKNERSRYEPQRSSRLLDGRFQVQNVPALSILW